MGYDEKCADLADAFLDDYHVDWNREKLIARLAQAIQDVIEGELTDLQEHGAIREMGQGKESR